MRFQPGTLLALAVVCGLLMSFTIPSLTVEAGPTPARLVTQFPSDPQDTGPKKDHKLKPCKDKENDKDKDKDDCLPEGGSSGIARADFNGDGIGDLAIGAPNEDVDGLQDAGGVAIIYGTPDGLHQNLARTNQFFTEGNVSTIASITPGTNNQFGAALAAGKFNGDIFSDLAIGIPLKETEPNGVVVNDSGYIIVLYGSASGLSSTGSQFFVQGELGLLDTPERGDRFGSVLSWGDFDGDTFGDLVVGIQDEDDGPDIDAGAVQVIYGSAVGLTTNRNQIFFQSTPGILDASEAGDKFGTTLAAGDFDGDDQTDLAVGVPLENVGSISDAGAVNVIYGSLAGEINSAGGLTDVNDQFLTQDAVIGGGAVLDQAEPFDRFGSSLAAGDFDTGRTTRFSNIADDLAIGVPFEDLENEPVNTFQIRDAGAVNVLYGSAANESDPIDGLSSRRNQFFTQDTPNIPGEAEEGDRFGSSLAAAEFSDIGNDPSETDLAIGVPFEDVGSIVDAGAVNVIYGSIIDDGLDPTPTGDPAAQIFDQNTTGVLDTAETGDRFGTSLSGWNFGRDAETSPSADLAIGIPFEDFSGRTDVGAVAVLYGGFGGVTVTENQFWNQNSAGIIDFCEDGDRFGTTLY